MEKKMNDKGFSLVELIVVIAIMAVLIGVLAPQFIKYVEKSRVSTDIQNVDQIVTAIQTYAAENGYEADEWNISTATSPTSGKFIEKALKDANLPTKLELKSKKWLTANPVKVIVTTTDVKAVGKNETNQTMANGAE